MPLVGFTSMHYPDRVFSYDELLALLASSENITNFTPAMVQKALQFKGQHPDALTATGLTGTCPREFRLRRSEPYTLELEQLGYAFQAVTLREMLAQADPIPGTLRNVQLKKHLPIPPDNVWLPAQIDEVVTDYRPDSALIRAYKHTQRLPDRRGPYPLHRRELAIYRLLLSNFNGLAVTPDGTATFEALEAKYGEVVYLAGDQVRRYTFQIDEPHYTMNWLGTLLYTFQNDFVSYADAVDEQAWGFHWKCGFCPVREQCFKLRVNDALQPKKAADPFEI